MVERAWEHDEQAHAGAAHAQRGERAAMLQEDADIHRLDVNVADAREELQHRLADRALVRVEGAEAIIEGHRREAGVTLVVAAEFAAAGGAYPEVIRSRLLKIQHSRVDKASEIHRVNWIAQRTVFEPDIDSFE